MVLPSDSTTSEAVAPELSDAEAAKFVNFADLGVEPMTSSIPEIRSAYESVVAKLGAGSEKTDKLSATDIRKLAEAKVHNDGFNVQARDFADDCIDEHDNVVLQFQRFEDDTWSMEDMIGKILDSAPALAVKMRNGLQSALSLLDSEIEYQTTCAEVEIRKAKNVVRTSDEEASDLRLSAQALRGILTSRIAIAEITGDEIPADMWKTEGERKGLNISRIPRGENAAPTGRAAYLRHLELRVDDHMGNVLFKSEPGTVSLPDVIHRQLNHGMNRTTYKRVMEALKSDGVKIESSKEWWSFKLGNRTLWGRLAPEQ